MSKQLTPSLDFSDTYEEAELELHKLALLYGTNPTDAGRRHGIAEYIEVTPKKGRDKGKTVKIRIQDVEKALLAFFLKEYGNKNPDITHFNHMADVLAEEFKKWLLDGKYTDRYQAIDTPDLVEWLTIIVNMVVSHYIQECKYKGFALYGRKTFANRDVATQLTRIKLASSMTENAAIGINRAHKRGNGEELPDEIKMIGREIVNDVDTKVKDILGDNPVPFIAPYLQEIKKLQGKKNDDDQQAVI